MKRRSIIIIYSFFFLFLFCHASSQSKKKKPSNPFSKLKSTHPRLIITPELIQNLNNNFGKSEMLTELILFNQYKADQYLKEKVPVYTYSESTKNMSTPTLDISNRVLSLTVAYLLSKNKTYLDRAILELKAMGKMSTWNIKSRYDFNRLAVSFSLCYDWLYNDLTSEDRIQFKKVILKKVISVGTSYYIKNKSTFLIRKGYKYSTPHCALMIATLTIGNKNSKATIKLYKNAMLFIKLALKDYDNSGSYYGGPTYWALKTSDLARTFESLNTAFGKKSAMLNHKGFSKTCDFMLHNYSNTYSQFNYADSQKQNARNPFWLFFWFSKNYNKKYHIDFGEKVYKTHFDNISTFNGPLWPVSIMFFQNEKIPKKLDLPLDVLYEGNTQVAFFRSKWSDPKGIWLGMKAGKINLSYTHMDIGSFELEADGERWAMDLGKETKYVSNFHYWDRKVGGVRWKYFRTNVYSHNTLVIGHKLQNVLGNGQFKNFLSQAKNAYAVIHMTSAYSGQATKVNRGFAFLNRKRILIQDEISNPVSNIRWAFLTSAKINLEGNKATLIKNNQKMFVEILSPSDISFVIKSTEIYLDKNQVKNTGTSLLSFNVPKKNQITIKVLFTPGSLIKEKFSKPINLPLSKWPKQKAKNKKSKKKSKAKK